MKNFIIFHSRRRLSVDRAVYFAAVRLSHFGTFSLLEMAAPSPAVAAEVESLDRILTRLALTKEEQLEQVRKRSVLRSLHAGREQWHRSARLNLVFFLSLTHKKL